MSTSIDNEQLKKTWIDQLSALVDDVKQWAESADWSTRVVEKKLEEVDLGCYKVPALMLQKETVKIIVEPIARQAPGVDGVVDIYLLPAYDDIATLYFHDGIWNLHYLFPSQKMIASVNEVQPQSLSRETFIEVIEEMVGHAI